jgi:transcriptional regulator GlxA family with amidase domain
LILVDKLLPAQVQTCNSDLLPKESTVHVAILTFEGYNELDSLIALGILNRAKQTGWRVSIACPTERVRSMNGVVIESQVSLEEACAADAVIVGSGLQTREVVEDSELMARLQLDPSRQLLAAQCSGTLILAKLGLLNGVPACTDLTTKPWVLAAGVEVLNQPFYANGNLATAGGCLASQYLAAWVIARAQSVEAAEGALHYVAPVGEKEEYVSRGIRNIMPYIQQEPAIARSSVRP